MKVGRVRFRVQPLDVHARGRSRHPEFSRDVDNRQAVQQLCEDTLLAGREFRVRWVMETIHDLARLSITIYSVLFINNTLCYSHDKCAKIGAFSDDSLCARTRSCHDIESRVVLWLGSVAELGQFAFGWKDDDVERPCIRIVG